MSCGRKRKISLDDDPAQPGGKTPGHALDTPPAFTRGTNIDAVSGATYTSAGIQAVPAERPGPRLS
ncbi:FMN-binding protein [Streptomyces bungoensis]